MAKKVDLNFMTLETAEKNEVFYIEYEKEISIHAYLKHVVIAIINILAYFNRGVYEDRGEASTRLKSLLKGYKLAAKGVKDSRGEMNSSSLNDLTYVAFREQLVARAAEIVVPKISQVELGTSDHCQPFSYLRTEEYENALCNRAVRSVRFLLNTLRYALPLEESKHELSVQAQWGEEQDGVSIESLIRAATGVYSHPMAETPEAIHFILLRTRLASIIKGAGDMSSLKGITFLEAFRDRWWKAVNYKHALSGTSGPDNKNRMTSLPIEDIAECLNNVFAGIHKEDDLLIRANFLEDWVRYQNARRIKPWLDNKIGPLLTGDRAKDFNKSMKDEFPAVKSISEKMTATTIEWICKFMKVANDEVAIKETFDELVEHVEVEHFSDQLDTELPLMDLNQYEASIGWPTHELEYTNTLKLDTKRRLVGGEKVIIGAKAGYVAIEDRSIHNTVYRVEAEESEGDYLVTEAVEREGFFSSGFIDMLKNATRAYLSHVEGLYDTKRQGHKSPDSYDNLEKQIREIISLRVFYPVAWQEVTLTELDHLRIYYDPITLERFKVVRDKKPGMYDSVKGKDGIYWNAKPISECSEEITLDHFESLESTSSIAIHSPDQRMFKHLVVGTDVLNGFRACITYPRRTIQYKLPNLDYSYYVMDCLESVASSQAVKFLLSETMVLFVGMIMAKKDSLVRPNSKVHKIFRRFNTMWDYLDQPKVLHKSDYTNGDRVGLCRYIENLLISELIGEEEAEYTAPFKKYHPDLDDTKNDRLNHVEKSVFSEQMLGTIKVFRDYIHTMLRLSIGMNKDGQRQLDISFDLLDSNLLAASEPDAEVDESKDDTPVEPDKIERKKIVKSPKKGK